MLAVGQAGLTIRRSGGRYLKVLSLTAAASGLGALLALVPASAASTDAIWFDYRPGSFQNNVAVNTYSSINPDGSGRQSAGLLNGADGYAHTISPDRQSVAWLSYNPNVALQPMTLHVSRLDGTATWALYSGLLGSAFAWSPDSTRIGLIDSAAASSQSLVVVPVDGSVPVLRALPSEARVAAVSSWSSDFVTLAITRYRVGCPSGLGDIVSLVDLSSLSTTDLTGCGGAHLYPAISPDGDWVSFHAVAAAQEPVLPGHGRIERVRTTGADRQIVVLRDSLDGWSAWSPDSSRVAYGVLNVPAQTYDLRVVDVSGTGDSLVAQSISLEGIGWANPGIVAGGLTASADPGIGQVVGQTVALHAASRVPGSVTFYYRNPAVASGARQLIGTATLTGGTVTFPWTTPSGLPASQNYTLTAVETPADPGLPVLAEASVSYALTTNSSTAVLVDATYLPLMKKLLANTGFTPQAITDPSYPSPSACGFNAAASATDALSLLSGSAYTTSYGNVITSPCQPAAVTP
jgi:hypothetical protein